ncbi:cupredoxin family copper-binding protein [Candidatus Woesearchaeota archaeon]|nr:cupredoxin family copper-binding protein [Candidatus Woesearchaeota archaeon]
MKKAITIFAIISLFLLIVGCTPQVPKLENNLQNTVQQEEDKLNNQKTTVVQEPLEKTIESSTQIVEIKGFAFVPQTITLKVGDTVVWKQKDSAPHTVTGDEFSSQRLSKGEDFVYTFTAPGTYDYLCSVHPSMRGTVVVK